MAGLPLAAQADTSRRFDFGRLDALIDKCRHPAAGLLMSKWTASRLRGASNYSASGRIVWTRSNGDGVETMSYGGLPVVAIDYGADNDYLLDKHEVHPLGALFLWILTDYEREMFDPATRGNMAAKRDVLRRRGKFVRMIQQSSAGVMRV